MNVFVLCTEHCGSLTFINACRHISNYTASHEANSRIVGDLRMDYPAHHIEADSRLSWFLGRLDQAYGDDAVYIHLKGDTLDMAKSLLKQWNTGIIGAYQAGMLSDSTGDALPEDKRLTICLDYCHTVNTNIALFLKDKTKSMTVSPEQAKHDFKVFWEMIHAEGDFGKAMAEWDMAPDTTQQETNGFQSTTTVPDGEANSTEQLQELVKALSVHQRQMFSKIEDLHAHHEQLYTQQNQIYEQVDALFSIFSMLKIRYPLPTMRGWPVSPDFVKILMSQIFERRPKIIVEAGCGVSTLISAYSLEVLGDGHVTSLDHDKHFAEETRKNVRLHQLENQATILTAPLSTRSINNEPYPWYTFSLDTIPESIDLLVIDGPPANMGDQVRYPAIPVLFDRLADDAVILLDDAAREGERKIVERWMAEFGCFEKTYIQTEKGAVILRKTR